MGLYVHMDIETNFIFIRNNEKNRHNIESSILYLMSQKFEKFEKYETDEESDFWGINLTGCFMINDVKIKYKLIEYSKKNISYLNLLIDDNVNLKYKIENMEIAIKGMQEIVPSSRYIRIVAYDPVSEYYCNKIYNKLNTFERKLRKLMYLIYTFDEGYNFYDNLDENLKAMSASRIKKDNNTSNKNKKIEDFFYGIGDTEISQLLFNKKWENEIKSKANIVESIDESNISKEKLQKEIASMSPKSDWDLLFSTEIKDPSDDIKQLLCDLIKLRNDVAHCKFFYKDDYQKCIKILKKLNVYIDKAISLISNKDFQKLNMEYFKNLISPSIKELQRNIKQLSTILEPFRQKMQEISDQLKNIHIKIKI